MYITVHCTRTKYEYIIQVHYTVRSSLYNYIKLKVFRKLIKFTVRTLYNFLQMQSFFVDASRCKINDFEIFTINGYILLNR